MFLSSPSGSLSTLKISSNPLSYKYLDVCINGSFVEKTNTFLNCSTCSKCMRTLITLDYYKKLENFKNIFDLNKYYNKKDHFIKNLDKKDPLQREIIELYASSDKK